MGAIVVATNMRGLDLLVQKAVIATTFKRVSDLVQSYGQMTNILAESLPPSTAVDNFVLDTLAKGLQVIREALGV